MGRFDKMKTLRECGFRHAAVHVVNDADIASRNTDSTKQSNNDTEDDDKGRDDCANGFVH